MDGHRAATTREPPHRIRLTGRLTVTTQVRALYRRPVTRGHKLLADIKAVFGDADRMATADLLERLAAIDEAPWGDWYDKPIDARWLTRHLKPFGVNSTNVRIGESSIRGYLVEDLMDVRGVVPVETGVRKPDPVGELTAERDWSLRLVGNTVVSVVEAQSVPVDGGVDVGVVAHADADLGPLRDAQRRSWDGAVVREHPDSVVTELFDNRRDTQVEGVAIIERYERRSVTVLKVRRVRREGSWLRSRLVLPLVVHWSASPGVGV